MFSAYGDNSGAVRYKTKRRAKKNGERAVTPGTLPEYLAKGANSRFDLSGERNQASGSDRIIRSIRGVTQKHR